MDKVYGSFAIYSRKSRMTGKGESIENQIEMCRQYILMKYGESALKNIRVYEDEGFSGGNLERPQFKRMMTDAKAGKFDAIVVYRLDRISRNIGDFAGLVDELREKEIGFISIKEQFDTGSAMGRAMMFVSSVFSQLERETIAERIRDNMYERAKTGRWLGGNTPTGYASESITNVRFNGKSSKACKLKIIEEEAQLVRLIFDKFIQTGSITKTDQYLLEHHIKTKRGNDFTRFAIKNILSNPVYLIADDNAYDYLISNKVELFSERAEFDGKRGIMAYNRTLQQNGRAHQIKPTEEWIVSVGLHEGIIESEKWIQAQNILGLNKSRNYHKPRTNTALLSGLIYCAECGDHMRPKLTNRTNSDGEQIYSYLCTTKERSKGTRCNMKNPNGNKLDKRVLEEIKKLGRNSDEFAKEVEEIKRKITAEKASNNTEITKLNFQIKENESVISGLVTAVGKAAGTGAEQYIIKQIDELHEKNEQLKIKLSELESLTKEHELSDMEFDIIRQMLSNFSLTLDDMNIDQKRAAIRTFVRKAVWDGENLHLYIYGNFDDIVVDDEPLCEYSK